MGAHESDATVGAWNSLVRRARMADRQKLAALVVSSYANSDGTGIHCGVGRLAVDMDVSYRTAQRYLSWLRAVGLIEVVREGSRRKGLSDEYRLIVGPDVLEHLEVLDPDRYAELRGDVMGARYGANQRTPKLTSKRAGSEDTQADVQMPRQPGDQRTPGVTSKKLDQRTESASLEDTQGVAPPSLNTSPISSPSPADEKDLRTAVTGPRENHTPQPLADVIEMFGPKPTSAPPPKSLSRSASMLLEAAARRRKAIAEYQARLAEEAP
jgi:DNA-binding transcriptional ArsR family regulator